MISTPLVSTIIPTYNRENLVGEAIESVLDQSYRNVEVVVVDDGSTDGTVERLKQYDNRIKLIVQRNSGPAAARNRGIAASSGDFVAFLDSDDLWLPTKLEKQIAVLRNAESALACCLCNIRMSRHDRETTSFDLAWLRSEINEGVWLNPAEVLGSRFVLFNQGAVVPREVLERVGGYNEKYRLLEDYEFALRLSLEGAWGFVQEPLVTYRDAADNSCSSNAKSKEVLALKAEILESHANGIKIGSEARGCALREVRRCRRELRAVEAVAKSSWGARFVGKSCMAIERVRAAGFRRSPWFPKMITAPSTTMAEASPARFETVHSNQ